MSAVKSGGGLQLASSFLAELSNQELRPSLILASREISRRLALSPVEGAKVFTVSDYLPSRTITEYAKLNRVLRQTKVETVFTFFGAGVPVPKHVTSIVSVAYPIICYPDSQYWSFLSARDRVRQSILNWGRVRRLRKHSHVIVAETEVMATRLRQISELRRHDIRVCKPATSALVPYVANPVQPEQADHIRILFLAGCSPHKNLWRLPEISRHLSRTRKNFKFVLSVSRQSFMDHCMRVGTADDLERQLEHFEFVGSLPPERVSDQIDRAHFVANFSDLESFTNNYMEAWSRCRPLIISDRDFARALCGDSAAYLEPHAPEAAAHVIANACDNYGLAYRAIHEAREKLLARNTQSLYERVQFIRAIAI